MTHVSRGRFVRRKIFSLRIGVVHDARGGILIVGPGDDDVRLGFHFEQWHRQIPLSHC